MGLENVVEECQRCLDVDEDRRTLRMACFYDMAELNLPLKIDESENIYTLRVCKKCRADWMKAIEYWFNHVESNNPSCGSGIYIRKFGDNVEISEEEWNELSPGVKPVRIKR